MFRERRTDIGITANRQSLSSDRKARKERLPAKTDFSFRCNRALVQCYMYVFFRRHSIIVLEDLPPYGCYPNNSIEAIRRKFLVTTL